MNSDPACCSAPEYDAPLFLDCCGLVRQVLRDLADEFGFAVGPWNQAYMVGMEPGIHGRDGTRHTW